MTSPIITALSLLLFAFVLGLHAGGWVADRLNRKRKNAQAELGEQFAQMLEDHRKTLLFANQHVTIQTEYRFTSGGHRYVMTLAAKPVEIEHD